MEGFVGPVEAAAVDLGVVEVGGRVGDVVAAVGDLRDLRGREKSEGNVCP